jgi:hypothetical protein
MAFQGFVSAVEVYNGDGRRWDPEDTAIFDAVACGKRLTWRPTDLISAMVINRWPNEIRFDVEGAVFPPARSVGFGVLDEFLFGLGQSLIANFFERERSNLESKFGKPARGWPPVWNFARVVRNAMSHGGGINIRDQASVSWGNLTYSAADSGRLVVNRDFLAGDLLLLVRDMEDAL